ncbi:phosphatase PAP2 family protein [Sphingobacterium sp. SGG-5]|uniref:phosphatase PAP2 family protein n=1 Tax=Sphingobacterium sp. SGG-5 TaxID=2710881 RepID=UPI0013EB2273|nr:phosphatase PAP2 family protein [Sphingobacterium sp. SGG-5]NGM61193.1 phosphatase PAP2 family protein [Sphingobacterium sp. SGG-5]
MYPEPMTFRQLFWNFRFVLLALLLVELVCGYISIQYTQVEQFRMVNAVYHAWADEFFRYYTNIGDGLFIIIVGLLLVFARYKYAILTITSFLLSGLVAQIIKRSMKMPRPGSVFKDDPSWYTLPDYHIHGNYSFPSGHTTSIFALMMVLYYVFPSQRKNPLFFILACLAGYSRVYLSQHWPGDVYIGALVGTVTTLVVIYAFEQMKWYHSGWANKRLSARKANQKEVL